MHFWSIKNINYQDEKLTNFLSILFLLFLIDAILSYWVPNFIQNIVGNSFYMGLIVSFSSIIGLIFDMIFSEALIGSRVKKVIWLLAGGIGLFIIFLGLSFLKPLLIFLLLAMAGWGFYYDLFGFSSQQYVSETTSVQNRPLVWSIVSFIRNLAYFIGPIIVVKLLFNDDRLVLLSGVFILILASLSLLFSHFKNKSSSFKHQTVSFLAEFRHWQVLFDRVWPLLIVSFILGLIDATYWTTGTIVTNNLAKISNWGGLFLPLYILPFLLSGGLISKFKIQVNNRLILALLISAGGLLALINVYPSLFWKLAIVFISSTLLAISWPLINADYTNLLVRMRRKREHLIGLSDSMLNLAYIFGPILAGGIAALVGGIRTFTVMGLALVGVNLILWLILPGNIKLPQKEIKSWPA